MSMKYCSVPGCKEHKFPFHSFPRKPSHLFKEWKRRIQLPENITDEFIRSNKRVCSVHFGPLNKNYEVDGNYQRLIYCSVPTINVPGFSGEPTKENSFLLPPKYVKKDMTYLNTASSITKTTNESSKPFIITKESNKNNSLLISNNQIFSQNLESKCVRKKNKKSNIAALRDNAAIVVSARTELSQTHSRKKKSECNTSYLEISSVPRIIPFKRKKLHDDVATGNSTDSESMRMMKLDAPKRIEFDQPLLTDKLYELVRSKVLDEPALSEELDNPVRTENLYEIVTLEQPDEPERSEELNNPVRTENLYEIVTLEQPDESERSEELNNPARTENLYEIVTLEQPDESERSEEFNNPVRTENLYEIVTLEQPDELERSEELNNPVRIENLYEIVTLEQPDESERSEELDEPERSEELNNPVRIENLYEIVTLEQPDESERSEELNNPVRTENLYEIVTLEQPDEPERSEELDNPVRTENLYEIVRLEELDEPARTIELHDSVITLKPDEPVSQKHGVITNCKPSPFPLICRVCASSNAHLIPIHGDEGKECDLETKISSYLPVQVSEGDSVCFPCALTVISFHQLMINCKTANALFSLQIDDIQAKIIESAAHNLDFQSEQCASNSTHAAQATNLHLTENKSSSLEHCALRWKEIYELTNFQHLTCHLCHESFPQLKQLRDHLNDCEKIVCKKCRIIFQNAEELNEHRDLCNIFHCGMCTKSFKQYAGLHIHTRATHRSIKCPLCSKKFLNDLECETHKTSDHIFFCESCNKPFQSSLPVMKHRLRVMPFGALMCLSCFGVSQFIPKTDNQFIIEDKKALTTKFVDNHCSLPRSIEEGSTDDHADMDAGESEATVMTATVNRNGARKLNDHIYTIDNSTAICMHCSKTFSCENYLTFHIIKHHPTEPLYPCVNCYNSFQSEKHLTSHSMYKCPLICSICKIIAEGSEQLREHKQSHQKKPFPCNQCGKVLVSKASLRCHIKIVHEGRKRRTLCVGCGKLIVSSSFKKHYDRHHNTEPVQCKYCLKTVACNLLSQHITDAHLKGQFKCASCSAVFVQKKFLVRHFRRMHSSSSKPCVFCNTPFSNAESRDKHIANHHKKASFFVKLNNFDEYKCLHCEVVFDYTNMLDHKKMLEDKYGKLVWKTVKSVVKKAYNKSVVTSVYCNNCGKKFANPGSLNNHIQVAHRDESKFQCSYCPRMFKRGDYKKNHERTHTGERPYSCLICYKKFRNSSDCNRHVVNYHNPLNKNRVVILEKHKEQSTEVDEYEKMEVQHEVEIDHHVF